MFITAIGNAQGLGSYLIAVAMMMMGLEAAMSASGAVGATAGGWMKAVGKKTQDYAQRAALFAAGGGVLAGAGALAGAVDSRYDLRGRAAAQVRRLPFAGQNKWLKEQQYKNRNEWLKDRKEIAELDKAGLWRKGEKEGAFGRAWGKGIRGDRAGDLAQVDHLTKTGFDEKAYDEPIERPWIVLKTTYDVEAWIDHQNRAIQQLINSNKASGWGICFGLSEGGEIFLHTTSEGDVLLDACRYFLQDTHPLDIDFVFALPSELRDVFGEWAIERGYDPTHPDSGDDVTPGPAVRRRFSR